MSEPGLSVNVIDQTQGLGTDDDIYGAIVLASNRGPTTIKTIGSTEEFAAWYGDIPTTGANAIYGHMCAREFLEAAPLRVLRVNNTALYGGAYIVKSDAVGASAGIAAGTTTPDDYTFAADDSFAIFGNNPGAWNNSIKVAVTAESDSKFTITVQYSADGSTYSTVETWEVSKTQGKLNGFGENIYLETRINDNSKYIHVVDNTSVTTGPKATAALAFLKGSNGSTISATHVVEGWEDLKNSDLDISLLIAAGWGGLGGSPDDSIVVDEMCDAAYALDAFAILDAPNSTTSAAVISEVGGWSLTHGDFGAVFSPYVRAFDRDNNRYYFIPQSGQVAANYARLYSAGYRWEVAAGIPAGILGGVTGLIQTDSTGWTTTDRNALTSAKINPTKQESGSGYYVNGDWTLNSEDSILQSIGGRQNLTEIIKNLKTLLLPFLFENNTKFTRNRVTKILESYLRERQGRGGIDDSDGDGYGVICNTTNNTALVRSRHELAVDIYLRLPYTIRNIALSVILVNGEIVVSVAQG